MNQKYKIEEVIKNFLKGQYYKVLYYPKFYCKFNYIEHYWYHCKAYTRHYYKYSLEKLLKRVIEALLNIDNRTILSNYQ